MNSFDEVFAQVKSYITEHELISDVARDTWIETMSPVELDGQDAVFEVDTGFQQGIIQNNYKKMLEEVLEKVMGFPVNLVVHVVVPIEREQEPTPHIPDFNELEEKNAKLRDVQYRMKAYQVRAADMFMDQELLDARVAVHDGLGALLLQSRSYLDGHMDDEEELLKSLKYTNGFLYRRKEIISRKVFVWPKV